MTIKLIVGLANPGVRYAKNRHNVGAWFVNKIAEHYEKTLKEKRKFYGYTTYLNIADTNVHLLIPTTFINLSGKAVAALTNFYHIQPDEILVAHDDLALPPSVAKFKIGGTGGHNGLKNIQIKFGISRQFYRLRIGIGNPENKNKVIDFVLSDPVLSEKILIDKAIDEALVCTKLLLQKGIDHAMNRMNNFKAII